MKLLTILPFLITIYLMIGLFTSVFAQVKMDSSYVEYKGNAIYELHGFSTFQQPVIVTDYSIGFRFSQDENENTYVPMGSHTLTQGNRKIHWVTEIVNPPFGNKIFFEPSIIPVAEQKKFRVTNELGRLINIFDEPIIESNLSDKAVSVGERAVFIIFASGTDLEYEWFYRTRNTDSTVVFVFDSLGVIIDSFYVYQYTWNEAIKIGGATSSTFQTIPAPLFFNGRKYFVRVYNNLGEVYSRQSILSVIE